MTTNNSKMLCPVCLQEKPAAAFSTLTRRSLDLKQPIGDHCAACYLMQLVTHHPSYRIGEDGQCIVDYVPYAAPRLEYVTELQQLLLRRLEDTAVQAAFATLGSLEMQAEPFKVFARQLGQANGAVKSAAVLA